MKKEKIYSFKFNFRNVLVVTAIVVVSALVVNEVVHTTKEKMRENLLQNAQIVAASINIDRLTKLNGDSTDLLSTDYIRIKQQLVQIKKMYSNCAFIYLMHQRSDKKVVFLVDAQSETSNDYAPPGLIYTEISPEYLDVFINPKPTTVGPITDRWGTLITALIPITNSETGEQIALLGMDFTIVEWNKEIMRNLLPFLITILISILLAIFIQKIRLLHKERDVNEKIRKNQEHYKYLVENAADGIISGNLKGIITNVNNSFCQMSGYDADDIIGKSISTLFSNKVLENTPLNYQKVLAGETIQQEREMITKSGEIIIIEMRSKRVDEETLQSLIRDVSLRKRNEKVIREKNEELIAAEEELRTSNDELKWMNEELERQAILLEKARYKAEESDKLKSTFLANMSHEVRTPMNAIIGFSDLILDSEALKGTENEFYFETIIKQGEHLLQLINDIVDLSKIEANQITILPKKVILNNVIRELNDAFSLQRTNSNEIEIRTSSPLSDEKTEFITDEIRLKQVFNNLIGNALKFTKEGYVAFGYDIKNDKIIFFVEDTGIGMPPEQLEKIFDRFHRLNDGHTSNYHGTGLGLSISKKLVELLKGQISVTSELNKGSRFEFTIGNMEL